MKSVWQREKLTQTKNPRHHEEACLRVRDHFQSRFLRQYVARKLRSDPVYPAVYEAVRSSPQPLLDVGCGLGLLGFYLRERGFKNPIIGFDCDLRKIRAGKQVAGAYPAVDLHARNLQDRLPEFSGTVAMLDVLHYLSPVDQNNLLLRLVEQIAPGGALLVRDCPCDGGIRYAVTFLIEKFAQLISWNVPTRLYFPSRESILRNFSPNEFTQEVKPLWGATPFNNHFFTLRRRAPGAALSAG
jgi:2-polyprenyl-3-methyl-5-hydroxy-6-metoxy-1,4-benzoquinol methylase